jgi:hypothetical protein
MVLLFGLSASSVTAAQEGHTLNWPVGEFRPYSIDSGILANSDRNAVTVYRTTVKVDNAAWLRLYFDKVDVPAGGEIRITSALDGEVQQLNAAELVMWDNSSAYFNGGTVYLELIAAPGTLDNRVVLHKVAAQLVNFQDGPCADDDCGICGTDDRVLSSELWTGRLMPVGCTGTIYNPSSCVVSAGHCVQSGLVIQFNVPASASNCYTYNPPVADQFPITNYQYQNAGIGADWSVMTTGTNGLGQHPFDRYGVYRPIAPTLALSGEASDWSYGVDNGQPTRSQVQQYSTGTIGSRYAFHYTFNVDITYGSSGSSLQHANQIIGIVTHCGIPCPDYATRIDLAAFVTARNSLCPDATAPTPNPMTFATPPTPQSTAAITMTATTATDPSLPVAYDFTFVSGGGGGSSSGWVTSTTFVDSGLAANTAYTYKVRARDAAPTPNMTSYSTEQSTATLIQTPTGVAFGTVTASTIDLSATGTLTNLGVGSSALYFDSTTPGGDGGLNTWVPTNGDQSTGLTPDTLYAFQVKARNQNSIETGYSNPASSKATLALVPAAPTLSGATQNTMQFDVDPNGNPAITTFAVRCTATSPLDPNWDSKYANGTGQPGAAETWLTDAQWGTMTINGLQPNTTYTFAVKARNQESVQTAFGPGASLATPPPTGACCRNYNASCDDGVLQANCAGAHDTWFEGQTCAQVTCPPPPPPTGACCRNYNASCEDGVLQANCTGPSDTWFEGQTCAQVTCPPPPPGACCVPGGVCQQLTQEDCGVQGGTWHGGPCLPCLCATCVGDANCDTIIDFEDINPFVATISGVPACNMDNCDTNCDGYVDFDDINLFVELLSTGAMCP